MMATTPVTAGEKCTALVGLLYGGYANVVIYGDMSGDRYLGRTVVISWEKGCDLYRRVEWDYALPRVVTPTYARKRLHVPDYTSREEETDTVSVCRRDGTWERMTRDAAYDLVVANGWPTNANKQPERPMVI